MSRLANFWGADQPPAPLAGWARPSSPRLAQACTSLSPPHTHAPGAGLARAAAAGDPGCTPTRRTHRRRPSACRRRRLPGRQRHRSRSRGPCEAPCVEESVCTSGTGSVARCPRPVQGRRDLLFSFTLLLLLFSVGNPLLVFVERQRDRRSATPATLACENRASGVAPPQRARRLHPTKKKNMLRSRLRALLTRSTSEAGEEGEAR
jgi:hypothetical protein